MIGSDLARQFRRNTRYLLGQLDGIDQTQSLTQPDFGANCLNWTLGHIVGYRRNVGRLLGVDITETEGLDRYRQESDPIIGEGPGVVEFSELMTRLEATEAPISNALVAASDARLEEEIESGEHITSRLARLLFLYFHDTLHAGQADVLAEFSRRT